MSALQKLILDIPANWRPVNDGQNVSWQDGYAMGHRDARHAASMLAGADAKVNREAIAELVGALTAFRDSGPSGGQDFLNWHESYRAAIEKARAAITKYGD